MPSQLSHWTLFDSNTLSNPNFHHFTQPFCIDKSQGLFVIASEHLPENNEDRLVTFRSTRGAELAIKVAQRAFSDILEKELNFSDVFLTLFSKQWKAAVLLDAIKNKKTISGSLVAIDQFSNDNKTTHEQQQILALYDPSIVLLYQYKKQLIFLLLGNTHIALVNRRYHCEIKKPTNISLSNLLVDLEHDAKPSFQLLDIEEYSLEMMALLSHRYTTPKTNARLHSNIIKCYRQFESKGDTEQTDNNCLLLFKKKQAQVNPTKIKSQVAGSTEPLKIKREKPKRRMATFILSLFAITTATAGSYYFWQGQEEKTGSAALVESKSQEPPKIQTNTQFIANNIQEKMAISLNKTLLAEEKAKQEAIKIKHLQAQAETLKQQEQANRKAEAAEAEKQRLIEEKKELKEQKKLALLKQQQKLKLAKKKQKKARLLLIKQDHEKRKQQEQKIAEQKKHKEEQLRIRKIALEQEHKKRKQLEKIEAKKLAEKRRLAALVKQRRLEFENNKIREQREKEKADNPPIAITPPAKLKKHNRPQNEEQDITKSNAAEKKRNMLAELERQKQNQAKTKIDKQKQKQKTAIHQLVNYSKTFNQHTTQLKQKLDGLEAIKQQSDASSNNALIHKRKLLKGKELIIRKRLNSIAAMYLSKLKLLCAKEKKFPVSTEGANRTERIARKIISQHVNNCSQSQSLSTSRVTTIFLNRYLK